ncbi:hypothetical protein PTKIN_Ptkin06aG0126900 [Pterospermum kingtungense]
MEKSRVVGLVLAVLSVISSEYACICSELDAEALFDLGNDLNYPENRLSSRSWKGSNSCKWQPIGCNNNNGAVIVIDPPKLYPKDYESSRSMLEWANYRAAVNQVDLSTVGCLGLDIEPNMK